LVLFNFLVKVFFRLREKQVSHPFLFLSDQAQGLFFSPPGAAALPPLFFLFLRKSLAALSSFCEVTQLSAFPPLFFVRSSTVPPSPPRNLFPVFFPRLLITGRYFPPAALLIPSPLLCHNPPHFLLPPSLFFPPAHFLPPKFSSF